MSISIPVKIPSPAIDDLYVVHSHLKICAALKKNSFIQKKIQKKFKKKYTYYATFQWGRYSVFKKKFDPENIKKQPSKVAHNSQPILFLVLAWLPKRPIISFNSRI